MLARVLTWYFRLELWLQQEIFIAKANAHATYELIAAPGGQWSCGHAVDDHATDECPEMKAIMSQFFGDDDEDDQE